MIFEYISEYIMSRQNKQLRIFLLTISFEFVLMMLLALGLIYVKILPLIAVVAVGKLYPETMQNGGHMLQTIYQSGEVIMFIFCSIWICKFIINLKKGLDVKNGS